MVIDPIKKAVVIYDGECPFCAGYIGILRLREAAENVELVDARNGGTAVIEALRRGYDLDDGMIVKLNDAYHHGADAIAVLATITLPVSWVNKLNAMVFSSPRASRLLYPLMRIGR